MRSLELKLERVDAGGGFLAVASTAAMDSDNERVMPGAFQPLPGSVPILVGHDWRGLPVGKGRPYYSNDKLLVDAQLADTERGQEVRTLMANGMLGSVSVGFTDPERRHVNGEQHVVKARLRELSIVVFGANEEARLVSVRSQRQPMPPDEFKALTRARITALKLFLETLPPQRPSVTGTSVARAYAELAECELFLANLDRRR